MRIIQFTNDTITIKEKNTQTVLFSYNLKQDALDVSLLDYLDCKVILLLNLCKEHKVTRIYLDYNSSLYQSLSELSDIEVFYRLPNRHL
jgi:hypothetical protein